MRQQLPFGGSPTPSPEASTGLCHHKQRRRDPPGSHPGCSHSCGTHGTLLPPVPLLGGDEAQRPSALSPRLGVAGDNAGT